MSQDAYPLTTTVTQATFCFMVDASGRYVGKCKTMKKAELNKLFYFLCDAAKKILSMGCNLTLFCFSMRYVAECITPKRAITETSLCDIPMEH